MWTLFYVQPDVWTCLCERVKQNAAADLCFLQVTRVVLLWVNNHFNDFEGDPAMTHFLEEFENNLEKEVSKAPEHRFTSL